jgi:translation initiation factor 3 subunit E
MAEWDITKRLTAHLDRHLIVPILDFLQKRAFVTERELQLARLQVLSKTNMIDYYLEVYQSVHDSTPADSQQKREEIVGKFKNLSKEAEEPLRIIQQAVNDQKNLGDLDLGEENLEILYRFAKCQYEIGNYGKARQYLQYYRAASKAKVNDLNALWGKLAADNLMQEWESALEDIKILQEAITGMPSGHLQARVWLIHWALFAFFGHSDGRDRMVEMFFDEKNTNQGHVQIIGTNILQALQTSAPHILRYLTVAVLINLRKRHILAELLNNLVRIIEQEAPSYSDPITQFIECLCLNFDFEGAQEKLKQCEEVFENDFFLHPHLEEFMENARHLLFEHYCRIHSVIDIGMVAERLNMPREKAEIWIVNLIRNAKLDARIDSQASQVIMTPHPSDVYEQVKQKTKNLPSRTMMLWKTSTRLMSTSTEA